VGFLSKLLVLNVVSAEGIESALIRKFNNMQVGG
jgi:hypothetical protein